VENRLNEIYMLLESKFALQKKSRKLLILLYFENWLMVSMFQKNLCRQEWQLSAVPK